MVKTRRQTSRKNQTRKHTRNQTGGKRERKDTVNYQLITKPTIERLMRHSGIEVISGTSISTVYQMIKEFLNKLLKDVVIYQQYKNKKTIKQEEVLMAIERLYKKFFLGDESNLTRCEVLKPKQRKTKRKPGELAKRMIKFYQKQSDCLYFSKTGFEKIVREVTNKYTVESRFSKNALLSIQLITESYLTDILSHANLIANLAERKTVYPKDIMMVRIIRNDPFFTNPNLKKI